MNSLIVTTFESIFFRPSTSIKCSRLEPVSKKCSKRFPSWGYAYTGKVALMLLSHSIDSSKLFLIFGLEKLASLMAGCLVETPILRASTSALLKSSKWEMFYRD